jgi:ribulose-phosphate 3-epimerase
MNASVCPTITAATAKTYQRQIEMVAGFAPRIHIDIADGELTPNKLMSVTRLWWPGNVRADIHVMYRQPLKHMDALIALQPQLIILHAEAQGDFGLFAQTAHRHGIEIGVALLQTTPVSAISQGLEFIDHVLVYSGKLGSFGGNANQALLGKVRALRKLKPTLEIGWDGGINDHNIDILAQAGVDVLNVGGFIQKSKNPQAAYATLCKAIHDRTKTPASQTLAEG